VLAERTGAAAPDRPVLVVALEGFVDAGFGAAGAAALLLETMATEPYARFDVEELLDLRERRPRLRVADGVHAGLAWPEIVLRVGRDRLGSGVALLSGPEPDMRWGAFAAAVADLARELDVRLLVGFGAFPAPAPHTRPIRLVATASSTALAQQVGFFPGTIDVPASVQAVVEEAVAGLGIPAVGLWARVPHYVAGMPYPAASLALLDGLAKLSGLVVDSEVLAGPAEAARRRVDELLAQRPEHADLVRHLEEQLDAAEGAPEPFAPGGSGVPSGEEIAAELERYLRGEIG
jgi:hypothetical protein